MVKGKSDSDQWNVAMYHGKYMDMIPVGTVSGSSSTYYCDKYYISASTSRVVCRGCGHACSAGGVSCAYAGYVASLSYTDVGSRLAFRGRIVKASSVAAYKSLSEMA